MYVIFRVGNPRFRLQNYTKKMIYANKWRFFSFGTEFVR